MSVLRQKLTALFGLLGKADETARKLPLHQHPDIERISRGLPLHGPRLMKRKGPGTEFFEARAYAQGDDPRRIHARLSARRDEPIVIEKEAEIRQHFYMWRDDRPSMDFKSAKASCSPRQAADIMLLALSKHIARNDERVGLLEGTRLTQGGRAAEWMATQMAELPDNQSGAPAIRGNLVHNSCAVLFSDFMMPLAQIEKTLDRLQASGVSGWLVMVADPQLIEFDFKGDTLFYGLNGEGEKNFEKAESPNLRRNYQKELKSHIEAVDQMARRKGFEFILQRTDEELFKGLRAIYNLEPKIPATIMKLGL
ncbi:MAG: DUF58 domain-containing protein [Micavibrio aeruginosavorus]|uniref:DUF58 domain-containing protein n=1 Tax=Micavibrio aeruginosavorus TaxID=349221 RepID=A0A7T5R242_9BACT|nr:MAG: DUF58 domain-containing protein [Micavibrio aeruginosavorus]